MPTNACDPDHPLLPGERAVFDLGREELFVVAAVRVWVAALQQPSEARLCWREVFRFANVETTGASAFDSMMTVIARSACRTLDVRCPSCPSLGADEESLLAFVLALQIGNTLAALGALEGWLHPGAVEPVLASARPFATSVAEAGLLLPATPSRALRAGTLRGTLLH